MLTGLACAAGFAIYSRDSLRVAVGIREKPDYLRDRGPDYQLAQTVNGLLGGHQEQQRTLVFLRHPYYLDIPYVNGDPSTTFEIDPLRMQSSEDWKAFFKKKNIAYVVRSPAYPNIIAAPLEEMEKNCELLPMTRAEVENFLGKRIEEKRTTIPVVILRVSPQ